MDFTILKRQVFNRDDGDDENDGDDDNDGQGYSNTATAIKWAFVGAILLLFLLWFVGGYYHAQRRIIKGLPPLAYHRFLLPRRQRVLYMPRPQFGYYPPPNTYGESYPMQNFAPPPPSYNYAEHIPPPIYQPPDNGTKVIPRQELAVPSPGPPLNRPNLGESSSTT
ncbi:hypothetical protein ABVK25_008948 [Lepraria finkii]|uniref:Uncharacterized protein n=1 Tax=Lepraria finkii TaxID=1340010 RepID=A0ABR4AYH8_9LECA